MSGNHEDFDRQAAEFSEADIARASAATLETIGTALDELLRNAHGHPVIEHAVVHEGNPIVFTKHLESSYVSSADVEHDFPFGEFTIYDGSCDRMAVNYSIHPDGSVHRTPGFLNGYNWDTSKWETKGEGEIVEVVPPPEQDWPGPLSEVEIDELSSMMFDVLGVDGVGRLGSGPRVLQALEIAASRGENVTQRRELHLVKGRVLEPGMQSMEPGATVNDQITIKAFDREAV